MQFYLLASSKHLRKIVNGIMNESGDHWLLEMNIQLSPFCISGFLQPSFLPSKGRSVTTLGTRWHFFLFFILLLFLNINLFYSLNYLFSPFLKGCRLECPFCVPVHKKKKKKLQKLISVGLSISNLWLCLENFDLVRKGWAVVSNCSVGYCW